MISMARHVCQEAIRTRHLQSLILICSVRNKAEQVFYSELDEIVRLSKGQIQVYWVFSQPESHLKIGHDYHFKGRLNQQWLQTVLPTGEFDVYLCGPTTFMQTQYERLRQAGQPDSQIFAEAFGSATIKRDQKPNQFESVANQALIHFNRSNLELVWSKKDGNLLSFAEQHGLKPEYGCRIGQCGQCKVKLLKGKVAYQTTIDQTLKEDEILLCSALPAASKAGITAQLSLDI